MSETTTQNAEQIPALADPFDEQSWALQPEVAATADQSTATTEKVEEKPVAETVVVEEKPTVTEQPDHIKELGFTSFEEAKAEVEKLRNEAKTPAEIKFANDESKRLFDYLKDGKNDEVFTYLNTQNKLSKAEQMKASEVIRLHLELTNSHYTPEDIQDVFEEKYSMPAKPQQEIDEEDSDFANRMEQYNQSVAKVNRRIERDAVEAKMNLAKLKSELVLPDIEKPVQVTDPNADPDPERTRKVQAIREQYVKSLETDFNQFDGHKVVYKDEAVEIPIAFTVTEQERNALRDELKNFDLEGFVSELWFPQGKPNVKRLMEDIHFLRNKDAILQKIANESGNQRLAAHLKEQSNISLGKTTTQGTMQPTDPKAETDKMADFFFSN